MYLTATLKSKPAVVHHFYSKKIILTLVNLLLATVIPFINAQTEINWGQLAAVKTKTGKQGDTYIYSDVVLALEEKEIVISGYYIPLSNENISLVLSAKPYNSCYFCGNAGPESVIEVWLKPNFFRTFQVDEKLTFRGLLSLNHDNTELLPYRLQMAEEIK